MAKIEFTEEMLDAIEAVKGRRDPNYWDPQCRRYMEKQKNLTNLTKDELEEIGRIYGIELDKRYKKDKIPRVLRRFKSYITEPQ